MVQNCIFTTKLFFYNSFFFLFKDVPENFIYLNKDVHITGVDDLAAFNETLCAMTTLGFSSGDCEDIFLVLALILHLGNVNIKDSDKNPDMSFIKVRSINNYFLI